MSTRMNVGVDSLCSKAFRVKVKPELLTGRCIKISMGRSCAYSHIQSIAGRTCSSSKGTLTVAINRVTVELLFEEEFNAALSAKLEREDGKKHSVTTAGIETY